MNRYDKIIDSLASRLENIIDIVRKNPEKKYKLVFLKESITRCCSFCKATIYIINQAILSTLEITNVTNISYISLFRYLKDNKIDHKSNSFLKEIIRFINENKMKSVFNKKQESYQFKADAVFISHTNFFVSSTFSEKENLEKEIEKEKKSKTKK